MLSTFISFIKNLIAKRPKQFKYVQCMCGWVHFAILRKDAEIEVANFRKYYDNLTRKEQIDYYGGSVRGITQYEHCHRCGTPSKYMLLASKIPYGSTMSPVIWRE